MYSLTVIGSVLFVFWGFACILRDARRLNKPPELEETTGIGDEAERWLAERETL